MDINQCFALVDMDVVEWGYGGMGLVGILGIDGMGLVVGYGMWLRVDTKYK
jgi:hypothetical protein